MTYESTDKDVDKLHLQNRLDTFFTKWSSFYVNIKNMCASNWCILGLLFCGSLFDTRV